MVENNTGTKRSIKDHIIPFFAALAIVAGLVYWVVFNLAPHVPDEEINKYISVELVERYVDPMDSITPYTYTYQVNIKNQLLLARDTYYLVFNTNQILKLSKEELESYIGFDVIDASKTFQTFTRDFTSRDKAEKYTIEITDPGLWRETVAYELYDPKGKVQILKDAEQFNNERGK